VPGCRSGVRWGTAAGGLIATYTVVDPYAVKDLGATADRRLVLRPAPVGIARTLRREDRTLARERIRGRWPLVVAVGLPSPLSYILVPTALNMGAPVSIVAPAREMSMMVGALLGMVVLREPVRRWRLAGCLMMIVGVVLLGRS
jgi:uncharacterized membrane protein